MKQEITKKNTTYQLEKLNLNVCKKIGNVNTISNYQTTGNQFNQFLKKTNQDITPVSIRQFLDKVYRKYSLATYNIKRNGIKWILKNQPQVFGNYYLQGFINAVFENIKRAKLDTAEKSGEDYLSKEEIVKLLEIATYQNRLIMDFLFKTGCRISEMINLRLKDIIVNTNSVRMVIRGKGKKQRVVYIKIELYKKIREKFKGNEFLFETKSGNKFDRKNLYEAIDRAGKKIDLDIHPHIFRHSCAMYLKSQGKSTKYISEYLGHSTTAITEDMYFHHKPGSEIIDLFE